jgi:hypothetical protein
MDIAIFASMTLRFQVSAFIFASFHAAAFAIRLAFDY